MILLANRRPPPRKIRTSVYGSAEAALESGLTLQTLLVDLFNCIEVLD